MQIIERDYGKDVIIFGTDKLKRTVYTLRSVRKLNNDCKEEQALINELEQQEKRAERKLILLAWSLENTLNRIKSSADFLSWYDHNRLDFNDYYYTQLTLLMDENLGYSIEYCNRSQHGWCL